MIFQWDPDVPLVVDEHIELPQLALVQNHTADCTQVYSTGNFTCLEVIFVLKRRLGYYLFHTYIPTCLIVIMSVRGPNYILSYSLLYSAFILVGFILDKARGCTCKSYFRGYITLDSFYTTCEITSFVASGIVSKSCGCLHVSLHDVRDYMNK